MSAGTAALFVHETALGKVSVGETKMELYLPLVERKTKFTVDGTRSIGDSLTVATVILESQRTVLDADDTSVQRNVLETTVASRALPWSARPN